MKISVIMSTYYREQPQYLDAAMKSIWTDQIRKPDEIVLVEDGSLTPQLDSIINRWRENLGDMFVVQKRTENKGLAISLNDAIGIAKGDLLARMDSDDISAPDRFFKQEKYMLEHPEVDILGGGIREFDDNGTFGIVRKFPLTMDDVKRTMHRMCPLAHPGVMFRKRFFDEGHSYSSRYYLCEDVELWFDAVRDGVIINNLPDVILNFRHNDQVVNRRGIEKALPEFLAYNNGIYKVFGLFTTRYLFTIFRLIFRLTPFFVMKHIYRLGDFRNKLCHTK